MQKRKTKDLCTLFSALILMIELFLKFRLKNTDK